MRGGNLSFVSTEKERGREREIGISVRTLFASDLLKNEL